MHTQSYVAGPLWLKCTSATDLSLVWFKLLPAHGEKQQQCPQDSSWQCNTHVSRNGNTTAPTYWFFLSNLYSQHGAWTQEPEINSHMLFWKSLQDPQYHSWSISLKRSITYLQPRHATFGFQSTLRTNKGELAGCSSSPPSQSTATRRGT